MNHRELIKWWRREGLQGEGGAAHWVKRSACNRLVVFIQLAALNLIRRAERSGLAAADERILNKIEEQNETRWLLKCPVQTAGSGAANTGAADWDH